MKNLIIALCVLGMLWLALGKPSSLAETQAALGKWNVSISHNGQPVSGLYQPQPAPSRPLPGIPWSALLCTVCMIPLALVLGVGVIVTMHKGGTS
jgi:hypothetical protein